MTFFKGHWQLIALTALVFALWNTPIVVPLKILVVFLHELAHGLAAILTDGSIESISLSPRQGGVAYTRGGSRFLILTAGYLGSLLLGVGLLWAALRTRADTLIMAGCGIVMLLVTVLYIRELFPLAFCIATGAAMLASARYLSEEINDLALRVIGLTSIIYVPYDIFSDTISRSFLQSDARMLAEEFGGTTMLWGGLWLIISLIVIGLCIRALARAPDSNISFRSRVLRR
ncbi:M50 family metallopeptidase [Hasllibacter sp. MH4015]|uniref:M50 family metallopeptidase n=1 Tax=Hasllibacter sp. MH4015 TaxID=2854029 RepID=UPI001CD30A0F|nr:M50 family metallopeptidase [Hasllibacter sp. MH4015]